MSRIFLSHSSLNSREAIALKQWLAGKDHSLESDVFLDVDRETGIPAGAKWREALQAASSRCESVILLMSHHWSDSIECRIEYDAAMDLHKQIFCARLEPSDGDELTAQWQRCDLFGLGPTTEIDIGDGKPVIRFSSDGLDRLLLGVKSAGIGANSFRWPPADDPQRAPYRGWEPLTDVDAAVFFGRGAEIMLGLEALRGIRTGTGKNLFVVLGPSGSGKSSFLRAGLLPRLRRDRQFAVLDIVRPERAVVTGRAGLAAAIHASRTRVGLTQPTLGDVEAACLSDPRAVRRLLEEFQEVTRSAYLDDAAPRPSVLLPLDQAEELFNTDAGPEAATFLDLIRELALEAPGLGLIVAATIRTDRYEAMQTAPELVGLQTVTFNDLRPMPIGHFTEVITGPAERTRSAPYRVQLEADLVRRLLEDCTESADALPILSLTLARLFAGRDVSGVVTLEHYRAMGGMKKIVQSEIDDVLSEDPNVRAAQLASLRSAFIPWLATINPENDQPMRRIARYLDLPADSRPLIDALVSKRLMVMDARGEHTMVEVALESLLRQWDDLASWLRERRHELKAADDLERAAAGWLASGCNNSWLLEGSRLLDALSLVKATGFERRLRPVHAFLIASQDKERQRVAAEEEARQAELRAAEERARHAQEREKTATEHAATLSRRQIILRRTLIATAVVAVIALVGGVVAVINYRQAQSRLLDATAARLNAEAGRLLTRPGSEVPAFQRILAAHAVAANPDDGALYSAVFGYGSMRRVLTPGLGSVLDVSGDGNRFVAVQDDTLSVYESESAAPVGRPVEVGRTAEEVMLSADGTRVAAAGDATVQAWNVDTGEPVGPPIITGEGSFLKSAFSADGRVLAAADGDLLQVWDANTGALLGPPTPIAGLSVNTVALNADGTRVATGGGSQPYSVQVWDVALGTPVGPPLIPSGGIDFSLAFSADGNRIAVGSANVVVVWDVNTGEEIGKDPDGETWATSLAFSPDGTRIAAGHFNGSLRIWDVDGSELVGAPLSGHTDQVNAVNFSADGSVLTSVGRDGNIRIWNVDPVEPLIADPDPVSDMVVSADGKLLGLATNPRGGYLEWVNVDTGVETGERVRIASEKALSIVLSPDGGLAVSTHSAGVVDTRRDETSCVMAGTGADGVHYGMAFSRDGKLLATSNNDGESRVWDTETCNPHGSLLAGPGQAANPLAFTPDGSRVAAAFGADVQFFDPKTGRPDGEPLKGHSLDITAMAIDSDGRMLVTGSGDQTLRRWDVGTHQPIGEAMAGHDADISAVVFSPDGSRIVSGAGDGIRVWDAKTGRSYGDQIDTADSVEVLAYNPDGSHFYSGGFRSPVIAWPATASPDVLCSRLTHNITKREWSEWVGLDIPYVKVCKDLPDPPD